jgi:hypothetical protein
MTFVNERDLNAGKYLNCVALSAHYMIYRVQRHDASLPLQVMGVLEPLSFKRYRLIGGCDQWARLCVNVLARRSLIVAEYCISVGRLEEWESNVHAHASLRIGDWHHRTFQRRFLIDDCDITDKSYMAACLVQLPARSRLLRSTSLTSFRDRNWQSRKDLPD